MYTLFVTTNSTPSFYLSYFNIVSSFRPIEKTNYIRIVCCRYLFIFIICNDFLYAHGLQYAFTQYNLFKNIPKYRSSDLSGKYTSHALCLVSGLFYAMPWCSVSTGLQETSCWSNCQSVTFLCCENKVHGANMRPIWGRQGSYWSHVGPMNFVVWAWFRHKSKSWIWFQWFYQNTVSFSC